MNANTWTREERNKLFFAYETIDEWYYELAGEGYDPSNFPSVSDLVGYFSRDDASPEDRQLLPKVEALSDDDLAAMEDAIAAETN